ncbi:MAG: DUF2087 domain-containing protein [Christensenellales bacterium]
MDEKNKIEIAPFLDSEGRIKQFPARQSAKTAVLDYLAQKFEADRTYSEKEVNAIIINWHTLEDYFLLRRSLVDFRFLGRTPNGAKYWVIKKKCDED